MQKVIIVGLAAITLALAGCGVDPSQAYRALQAQGLRDIRLGDYAFFGCDKGDTFRSQFTATGVNGQRVSGTVCAGWLKGTTVRFN